MLKSSAALSRIARKKDRAGFFPFHVTVLKPCLLQSANANAIRQRGGGGGGGGGREREREDIPGK